MSKDAVTGRYQLAQKTAVVGLGTYTGVMVAIGLGLGRYWLSLPPAEFVAWFTPNFWFLLPAVSLALTGALGGTIAALRLRPSDAASRKRWRLVLALLLTTVVVTLAYHVPANLRIWSGELSDAQVRTELTWWVAMHVLRVGPALVATWVAVPTSTPTGPPSSVSPQQDGQAAP